MKKLETLGVVGGGLNTFLKSNKCKIARVIAEAKLEEVEKYLDENCGHKNAEKVKEAVGTLDVKFSAS